MSRKLDSWLDGWLEYSSAWKAPEAFRLWSGVSAVSAALQRRVYTEIEGQRCFANTYVLLVGPPGIGKGNSMKFLAQWLKDMDGIDMAPDGLTKRAFLGELENASTIPQGGLGVLLDEKHHSLTAFIEELGVFLHAGDNDFVYTLCHVFDCPEQFKYKTHGSGENEMEKVCFTLLAACTPKGLKDILTDAVMEMGLSSRTMLIYAGNKVKVPMFKKVERSELLEKELKYDLRSISRVTGAYTFDNSAAEFLESWGDKDFHPAPTDSRFEHYNSRKLVHVAKLCQVIAASRRDDLVIIQSDVELAKAYILKAEVDMPKAIASIGSNPDLDAHNGVRELLKNSKNPVKEEDIREFLNTKMGAYAMETLLDTLERDKFVTTIGSIKGQRKYSHK